MGSFQFSVFREGMAHTIAVVGHGAGGWVGDAAESVDAASGTKGHVFNVFVGANEVRPSGNGIQRFAVFQSPLFGGTIYLFEVGAAT